MRFVEVRRHSKRGEGKGLSAEGRRLAEKARATLAPHYDLLISSPKQRAIETLQALGYVHHELDQAFTAINPWEPYDAQIERIAKEKGCIPLEACFFVPEAKAHLRREGEKLLEAVCRVARRLPEDGRALIISHGGMLEPAALLGCKEFDLKEIGGEISFCEGVEFQFDGERLAGVRIIRLR